MSISPDVVMGQRHVHVLTDPQLLRVEQLALGGLQVAGESVHAQQSSLLPLGRGLVALQELPAALGRSQGQTLLRLQEEPEVLGVQTLPVLGQLHQQEVDVRPGAELAVGLLELLAGHVGGQLLLASLDLLKTESHLWREKREAG